MKIKIHDPDHVIDSKFIRWLISQIKIKVAVQLKPDKLKRWDSYLNSVSAFTSIYKKKLLARDIILAGSVNLIFTEAEDAYEIFINPNINTPGLDRVKLITLCKLINFGNREQSSYPIFTEVFNEISDNIQEYVDTWLFSLV